MYPFFWQTSSGLFRSSVSWEYTLPLALILLIALGFVLLLALQWRDLRPRVTSGARWGLCLLRGFVYLLILGMLLNPTLMIQKVLRLLPSLAVVLDTSGSMHLPAGEDVSRLQQAVDFLHTGAPSPLQTLEEHYQINLYQLMTRCTSCSGKAWSISKKAVTRQISLAHWSRYWRSTRLHRRWVSCCLATADITDRTLAWIIFAKPTFLSWLSV